jgi:hypothetical protein
LARTHSGCLVYFRAIQHPAANPTQNPIKSRYPMTTPSEYGAKLKAHLQDRYWHIQRQGAGGCETCGYGADEVVDWEELLEEIDKFSASFNAPHRKPKPEAA